MEGTRKIPFSLETFLKRSWPLLVVGAVLILGLAIGLFRFALSSKTPSASTADLPATNSSSSQAETILVPRKLDGVPVSPEQADLLPFAVMVENAPEARPLAGVAEANVVVEAPVEGGITRFMLIYDATTTAEQIGPVRSARPYFIDLADGLNAAYAHVGGSNEALDKIGTLAGFRNLDQFFSSKYFWRSTKRSAPHNVYTRMDLLRQSAQEKTWSKGSFASWRFFTAEASSTERGDERLIRVPYGGTFNVSWAYDAEMNRYVRSQAGTVQKDADGAIVTASNVIVMLSEEQVLDDVGRLRIRTTGVGKAVVFRNGLRQSVTWRRKAGEWLTFETVDGGEVFFEPGKTWISIVTSAAMFPAATVTEVSATP